MERAECGRRRKHVSALGFRSLMQGKFPSRRISGQQYLNGTPAGIRQNGNSPYIFAFNDLFWRRPRATNSPSFAASNS
jgi:hypothetical protein